MSNSVERINACRVCGRNDWLNVHRHDQLQTGQADALPRTSRCGRRSARTQPPDYYLVLAWNYAEEIIRKERQFLAAGGRMIVPIPAPRIVSASDVETVRGDVMTIGD